MRTYQLRASSPRRVVPVRGADLPRLFLADAQADATAKNDHGETALDLALAGDCPEAVELLRSATVFEQVHASNAAV